MNKNSLFTKAIAGFLAVLMVLGTLVSLRGLSVVKAEAKVEPKAESEGTRAGGNLIGPQIPGDDGVDYRIDTQSGQYEIYEIPHSYVSYFKYVQVPYYGWDYKLQYEVGWFDHAAVDVSTASTFLSYGSDVSGYELNTDGTEKGNNPKQLVFHAQNEYWEPGAKTSEGGKRIPYTSPCAENMQDWLDDEAINHLPNGYELFQNKTTANQNYWISGLTGEQIWDRVRVLLYMSDPTRSEDAQALYDELYSFINQTIFPEMKNETFRYTNVTTGSTDGVGCLIRVGNGYLGANVTTQHEVLGEGKDAKPVDRLIVDWKNQIDQDATYELFYQLLIQHAILAFTSGGYYEGVSGFNMNQGPDGHSRAERARMTNWGTPNATDEHDQNSGYVRRIVNKLVAMAENADNIDAAKNDEDFSFCYLMYDKEKNNRPDMNPDDMYHYYGYFLAGAPASVGEASVDKDAYLTANGTYNIELYVKNDSSATTVDGKTMDGTTVIKDELSDKFEFINDTPEFVYNLIAPDGSVIDHLPDGVTITSTVNGSKVEFTGFPFNEYPDYELVITIKNIVAKDNTDGFDNENISTNANTGTVPGVYSQGRNTPGKDGTGNELKFPERKVSIRYRYIVYDFGLEMRDDVDFDEFFNDEKMHAHHEHETPIQEILTVDYMYGKVNTYSKVYPYVGARIMNDETGLEEAYVAGGYHHFTFGFNKTAEGTRGYFQPNEISHRDWNASALLQLEHETSAWNGSYTRNRYESPKYEWCTIRFIPATTVLYEADQNYKVDFYDEELADGTTVTHEVKRGSFAEYFDTNANAAKGTWDREGSFDATAYQEHYNNLYGFDKAYKVESGALETDSNGSAMKVTVTKDMYEKIRDDSTGKSKWPYMKFTFTGTGFSFTTHCALDTGVFLIDVVPAGQDQYYQGGPSTIIDENGEEVEIDYNPENFGKTYIHTIINTRYYGGSGFNPADTTPVNNQSVLHQVPVVRITDLAYNAADPYATGTYDVYVTPVYLPSFAELPDAPTADSVNVKGGAIAGIPGAKGVAYTYSELFPKTEETKGIMLDEMNCYIDTIRVYHPRGSHYENETTLEKAAYYSAHELNCQFIEVRKLLISKISALLNNGDITTIGGAMFIDYGPQYTQDGETHYINGDDFDPDNPDTFTVDHYKFYGPNNELYLPKGGSYAFSFEDAQKVTNLHLSMKITGANVGGKLIVRLLNSDQAVASENPAQYEISSFEIQLKSTTEMYYDLLGGVRAACTDENGVFNETKFHTEVAKIKAVAVYNESDNDKVIVSIMNIKLVYDKGEHAKSGEKIFTSLETVEFANVLGFGIKGDANGDRSVDMSDALVIMRASLNSSAGLGISGTFCADYNDDGMIDMSDALSTMRKALN